jgi:hypothetical protein
MTSPNGTADYTRLQGAFGGRVFACGRDPYFAGWPETLQLNHANPATQKAMIATLVKIAGQCDGVRCDMAMPVLPDVFDGRRAAGRSPSGREPPRACARRRPASASWPRSIREQLHAGHDCQNKMARFLEDHDEPRAAATFPPGVHEAAAVITILSPGLRFFHQGQFEGRRKRISPAPSGGSPIK